MQTASSGGNSGVNPAGHQQGWTDLSGRHHIWRQVSCSSISLASFYFHCTQVFFPNVDAILFQKKPWQAEKSKTGHQNKLVCLVALAHCGEWSLLTRELQRLVGFWPLQQQLQRLIQHYQSVGPRAFYELGYLPPPE